MDFHVATGYMYIRVLKTSFNSVVLEKFVGIPRLDCQFHCLSDNSSFSINAAMNPRLLNPYLLWLSFPKDYSRFNKSYKDHNVIYMAVKAGWMSKA